MMPLAAASDYEVTLSPATLLQASNAKVVFRLTKGAGGDATITLKAPSPSEETPDSEGSNESSGHHHIKFGSLDQPSCSLTRTVLF